MTTIDKYLIATDELADLIGKSAVLIFDVGAGPVQVEDAEVSAHQAFLQGHIPTSDWIDQLDLSDQTSPYRYITPAAQTIAEYFENKGVSDDTIVVLYSRSSVGWSARVWWLLHSIGFDNARLLDGGWTKWNAEARATETGPAKQAITEKGSITVNAREVFVGKQQVLEAVEQGNAYLVDSLPFSSYSGESPSKNGRRGHIKGAVNLPNSELLNPHNETFKDVGSSKDAFAHVGVTKDKPVITYCGGGIAASTDAFSALRIGFDKVYIYDASLAEWAKDASLPMIPGTP